MNDSPLPADPAASPAVLPPPPFLLGLMLLGLVGCLLTSGFAFRYFVIWERDRAGETIEAQRVTIEEAPWFKKDFTLVVDRIREVLPPGTRVFLEPTEFGKEDNQKARWMLYLTYYCHPVQIYVKKPVWAAGTIVDYPQWNNYHRQNPTLNMVEAIAIEELDIEWKLRMPFTWEFLAGEVYLERLVDGDWVRYDLWPFAPSGR